MISFVLRFGPTRHQLRRACRGHAFDCGDRPLARVVSLQRVPGELPRAAAVVKCVRRATAQVANVPTQRGAESGGGGEGGARGCATSMGDATHGGIKPNVWFASS